MRLCPVYPADLIPNRFTLFRRRVSRFISYCAYRTKSTGRAPRAFSLCSKSDRFLMMAVISSCRQIKRHVSFLSASMWVDNDHGHQFTLEKIFFRSNSLSSGTDFSRKKRALSVAADMIALEGFSKQRLQQFLCNPEIQPEPDDRQKKLSASRTRSPPRDLAACLIGASGWSAPPACCRASLRRSSHHLVSHLQGNLGLLAVGILCTTRSFAFSFPFLFRFSFVDAHFDPP